MKLQGERLAEVVAPTDKVIQRRIMSLRSYGPHSFASLQDDGGGYVQVAGGGITCMVERYNAITGRRERAHNLLGNPAFPDGTILCFGGGELRLQSDEWITATKVVEIFLAFRHGTPLDAVAEWRTAPPLN
ncbi:hypothetical protein GN316_15165 [Xylophilus sp. Kf1]|nr:hypothetical protein [Xylophilus sp. Kf1]